MYSQQLSMRREVEVRSLGLQTDQWHHHFSTINVSTVQTT